MTEIPPTEQKWVYSDKVSKVEVIDSPFLTGTPQPLLEHNITKETSELYHIITTPLHGEYVTVFQYFTGTELTGQIIKTPGKQVSCLGNIHSSDMFGSLAFNGTGKCLIITEGHEDAMQCHQVINFGTYHATTLPLGSNSVSDFIKYKFDKLIQYEQIILCFDQDKPGKAATDTFVNKFPPGKIRIAHIPLKDACKMVEFGKSEALKWSLLKAELYIPKQVVKPMDIIESVMKRPEMGKPWPWDPMTVYTDGRHLKKLHLLAAPPATGKTEVMLNIIGHGIGLETPVKTAWVSLEQDCEDSVRRLAGYFTGDRLHLAKANWNDGKIRESIEKFDPYIWLYSRQHGCSIQQLFNYIQFVVYAHQVEFVVIDNLKALSTNTMVDGKRMGEIDFINHLAYKFYELVMQLPVTIFMLSHLTTDKIKLQAYVSTSPKNQEAYLSRTSQEQQEFINRPGMSWESGRMPQIEHIYGGGAWSAFADHIWGLARNRVAMDDFERRTTIVKHIKARHNSEYDGMGFHLVYDYNTGALRLKDQGTIK